MAAKNKQKVAKVEVISNQVMIEGISSAHSWIKTQTMLRPTKLGKNREGSEESGDDDEDVITICLSSRDPNAPYGKLRLYRLYGWY